jgi:hypothetical protein
MQQIVKSSYPGSQLVYSSALEKESISYKNASVLSSGGMDEDTLEACGYRLIQKSRAKTYAVLAADELDKITYNGPWDSAYIINTAKRQETKPKVQHWYGLYITQQQWKESGGTVLLI